jgi:uncharacterized protein (TIGR04552 family)
MTDPTSGAGPSTQSGAFPTSQALRREAQRRAVAELSLQDVNEIRLLLRGDSVVDWHRLDLTSAEDVRRLLALNSIDLTDAADLRRLDALRARAVAYIGETLKLRVDEKIANDVDISQLLLLASQQGRDQRQACLLLKVMHIIYHLDARELRTRLAISDNEVFSLVEGSVVRMFDELRAAGVPVVEFSWSRKTLSSLITKMLVKRQTSAARVFDRLRFRLIVDGPGDLVPTLHVMLHRCIPFNYVLPGQTVNKLIDVAELDAKADSAGERPEVADEIADAQPNEFSGPGFRILNFIADLPVRVDDLLWDQDGVEEEHGRVVFVLAEFQILDRATAESNERGDASHQNYKTRQHARVKERLLRMPHHLKGEDGLGSDK